MTDQSMNHDAVPGSARRFPYRLTVSAVLGSSVLLGIFRAVILQYHIDPQNGLYSNAAIGTVFFILLALLIAFCVATRFFVIKDPVRRPIRNETVMTAFSATMCGMSFATVAAAQVISAIRMKSLGQPVFFWLELLLLIPSSVYFWHICIVGARAGHDSAKESLLPIFPALYLGVRIIRIFIDKDHQINASERSFLLLTLVILMMFFISEARFFVASRPGDDKDTHAGRFASFFVFALIGAALTVCVLLPYGIVSAFSVNRPNDLLYYVLGISLGLHAALRIIVY